MWGRRPKSIIEAGAKAPSFRLRRLEGGEESLDDLLAQGPVLLAFFKSSCPICQLTFPFLERLSASQSIRIVGISQDDERTTQGFNQRFGVTFPMMLDRQQDGYPASNAYGISSVPSLFLVEREGNVAKAFSGFSKRDLESVGERAGVSPFHAGESVPEWKAG